MGKHALLALMLLSLIVFDGSDASFVKDFRKLVDLDPKDNENPTTKDSPPPASSQNNSDPNPVDGAKVNKDIPPSTSNNDTSSVPQPQPPSDKVKSGNDNKKETSNAPPPASAPPPVPKKVDDGGGKGQEQEKGKNGERVDDGGGKGQEQEKGKNGERVDGGGKVQEQEKGKNGGTSFSQSTTNDTCGLNVCTDDGDLLACISVTDPKYLVVLLQNKGDGTIKVQLRSDFESKLGDVEVDKHKTEKVNITRSSSQITELTLNAGKGDCVLHTATHVAEGSFILRLPSYDKILTPVNGAYFLIFTVLVFGGTWACCMCRKKRHDEVPYQELEMAMPESASATNVESAEGWDQGWDDDWDDNVAVKSPVAARGISANGLTSRSANKDGWENNWDE